MVLFLQCLLLGLVLTLATFGAATAWYVFDRAWRDRKTRTRLAAADERVVQLSMEGCLYHGNQGPLPMKAKRSKDTVECAGCHKTAKVVVLKYPLLSRKWVALPPGWLADLGLDDSGCAVCSEACATKLDDDDRIDDEDEA